MEKQTIQTSQSPKIFLEIQGSLTMKGAFENEIVIRADSSDDIALDVKDDEVWIKCSSNCTLRVPRAAEIKAEVIHGDAVIKSLEGALKIGNVHGNLVIKDLGSTTIEKINGELVAKQIDGNLEVLSVDGNAQIRDIRGNFRVEQTVHGNLNLEDLEGEASARVDGNIMLRLDPVAGQKMTFSSESNLICRLPEDADVRVSIERGGNIEIKLESAPIRGSVRAPYEFTIGDGEAELVLSAAGNILIGQHAPEWEMIGDFDPGIEGIAEEITSQVEAQVEAIERQLENQLENLTVTLGGVGLSAEAAERISRRAREASERASTRAQEKMRRAQEKFQRKMEVAQRKAEARARAESQREAAREKRSWGFSWPTPPAAPGEVQEEPVSEDERMVILKMLEENKISLEEAEKLLQALDGS
jgi:hypothetical protein